MKTSRTSSANSWRNIGMRCASVGWDVSVALTKSEPINKLIRAGYEARINQLRKEASCGR